MSTKTGICEVHQYALNDKKKREVSYCPACDAWMCAECSTSPVLRAKAALTKFYSKKKTKKTSNMAEQAANQEEQSALSKFWDKVGPQVVLFAVISGAIVFGLWVSQKISD